MTHVRFTVDATGALTVVGTTFERCVGLHLREAGAEAACADVQPLLLPWDCCGGIKWVMDGPAVDAWQIVFWAQGRGTAFGLAVQVSGIFEERAGLLLDSTRTWWRRHA